MASAVVVAFTERVKPRMIASPDDAPARGRFWLDFASGRVTATELVIRTGGLTATIHVAHAEQSRVGLWLPVSMDERYAFAAGGETVEGLATYSNIPQFQVSTSSGAKD